MRRQPWDLGEGGAGWIAYQGRVESQFSVDVPLALQPCAASVQVATGLSTAFPPTTSFVITVLPEAPILTALTDASCIAGTCEIEFRAYRTTAYSADVLIIGWSESGAEWDSLSAFGTAASAERFGEVATSVLIDEAPAICFASTAIVGDRSIQEANMGELLCADLVGGRYVQREPTTDEVARYRG